MPKDSDMDKIAGKFDSDLLYVTVTKRNAKGTKKAILRKLQMEVLVEQKKINARKTLLIMNEEITVNTAAIEEERRNKTSDNERRDHNQHGSHREEERRNETAHIGGFSEELIRKWEKEPGIFKNALEVLSRNKEIVVTAVVAFSLGLLVSRKFQSSTAP